MSWATPANVIDSWVGKNAPTDAAKVQVWIDRAERLIRRSLPDLQPRLDAEIEAEPTTTDLRDTVVDVVVSYRGGRGKRRRGLLGTGVAWAQVAAPRYRGR